MNAEIPDKDKYLSVVDSKAYELLRNNDKASLISAENLLNEALQSRYKDLYTNEDLIELYYALGSMYRQQEKTEEAILAYDKILELDPSHNDALLMKSFVSIIAKKNEEPLEVIKKAKFHLKDEDPININNSFLDVFDERTAAVNDAITHKDKYLTELLNKACGLMEDRYDASADLAVKLLNEALQSKYKGFYSNEDLIKLYYALGSAHHQQNKTEEAILVYDRILELDPENNDALFMRSFAYILAKKYEGGLEVVNETQPYSKDEYCVNNSNNLLDEISSVINAVITPADLYKAFKDNQLKANNLYREKEIILLGNIDDITESITGLPQLEFNVGEFGKVICQFSENAFDILMEKEKGQKISVIATVIGFIANNIVLLDRCRMILEICQPDGITDKDKYLSMVLGKADELMHKNEDESDFISAEKLLNEALQGKYKDSYTNEDLIKLYYVLGKAYFQQDKKEETISVYDKILALDPEHGDALLFKSTVYVNEKKYEEALIFLKQAKPYLKNEDSINECNKLLDELSAAINAVITPAALYEAFKDNQLKANKLYRGKEIILTGNVDGITEDVRTGLPQLEFNVGLFGMGNVICQYPESFIDQFISMSKGQLVPVIGRVVGLIANNVILLENCRITQWVFT